MSAGGHGRLPLARTLAGSRRRSRAKAFPLQKWWIIPNLTFALEL